MTNSASGNNQTTTDPVAGKKVAEVFGEIVWVMSRDKQYNGMQLKELEAYVMPAILLRQFHITYAPVQSPIGAKQAVTKDLQPIKVELYALVSDDVQAKTTGSPPLLQPSDWRSGNTRMSIVSASIAFD